MLVVMQNHATQDQIDHVVKAIEEMGYSARPMPGETRTTVGLVGNDVRVAGSQIESMAGVAAALIAALALHGERPEPGLARFTPAGVLADWPLAQVREVAVDAGAKYRVFRPDAEGSWRTGRGGAPVSADLAGNIGTGLTLLHNSAPQRTLEPSDLADRPLGEYGLAPPRLTVTVRSAGGDSVTIEFGAANPLGLARYVRVAGRPEVLLLSSFVAEAWERVAAAP